MGVVARLVVGVAVVLVLTGAALYVLREPIAEAAVERVMARQGLENPDASVADVNFSRLTLDAMNAGRNPSAPDLALGDIVFNYDFPALIFRGKFKTVAVGGGRATVDVDENGAVSIAGWRRKPDAKSGPPPFSRLELAGLDLTVATPEGAAAIDLAGVVDLVDGGAFNLRFDAAKAGFEQLSLERAQGDMKIDLARDGAVDLNGAVGGDIATSFGAASGVAANISGRLQSWRIFFGDGARNLEGGVELTLRSSTIETATAPRLAPVAAGAGGVARIDVAGGLRVDFSDGGFAVSIVGDTLDVATDRGDRLRIKADAAPLYDRRNDERRLSVVAEFDMRAARGRGAFAAASGAAGLWRVDGTADLAAFDLAGVTLDGLAGTFSGGFQDGRFDGVVDAATRLAGARIGRLRINDAPAAGAFTLSVAFADETLGASPVDGACVTIDRASIRMEGLDMETRIGAAALCPASTPLVSIKWGDDALTEIVGALEAKTAYFRLGRTVFDGAPPDLDFTLAYTPALQSTRIKGALSGGRAILNKGLVLSDARGDFSTDLVGDRLTADALLSTMRVTQNVKLEMVAPVAVSGRARLADNVIKFDFDAATPAGAPLGKGEGAHRMTSGDGEAVFDSGLLMFGRVLQPDRLIPALKGVVSGATGAAEGRANFSWRPNFVGASATVDLDNVSFQGPGVAVTRTEGVSGKLAFSSMSPPTTDGEQTLSIAKIDLDALKLENGAMRFRAPGDNTIEIIEAEFPWFGGTIGAYESKIVVEGRSETTLQIDDVSLAGLLDYIKVEGLSGEGAIEGVLPLSIEGGKARINKGIVSSKGPGVIRYRGKATDAASQSNEQSALAFEILRELRFEKLSSIIDGPLDGAIDFNILFEGRSNIPVRTGDKTQRVDSPVKYRITINAPLLSLIEQAILSTDVKLQTNRARRTEEEGETIEN